MLICLESGGGNLWRKRKVSSEILESKFGGCLVREEVSACHSLWWKDLCKIWWGVVAGDKWFESMVVRKVGHGDKTRFWRDTWVGNEPLAFKYPRLYATSCQKEKKMCEIGV